jgi:hypothetical protein
LVRRRLRCAVKYREILMRPLRAWLEAMLDQMLFEVIEVDGA